MLPTPNFHVKIEANLFVTDFLNEVLDIQKRKLQDKGRQTATCGPNVDRKAKVCKPRASFS